MANIHAIGSSSINTRNPGTWVLPVISLVIAKVAPLKINNIASVTIKDGSNTTLDIVSKFRAQNEVTPIVLMGYLNPVEIMGVDNFVRRALEEGVDGVLMVDMPPAEAGVLNAKLKEVNIDSIFLVAPTTTQERVKSILNMTSGYVYYVSLKGVTGAQHLEVETVRKEVREVQSHTRLPVMVGFGVNNAQDAGRIATYADGVVVGSALVRTMEDLRDSEREIPGALEAQAKKIRAAMDKTDQQARE